MIKSPLISVQALPALVSTFIPKKPVLFTLPPTVSSRPSSGPTVFSGLVQQDVVAVYDSSYNQVFEMARAMKVNVSPTAKLMDHPIEDGSVRTDFRILNPTDIELTVICSGRNYRDVYQQIKAAFSNGDAFTVSTKADTFFDMMIQAMPHDETPEMYDVLAVSIKMHQVLLVETQYQPLPAKQVTNVNDQSTVNTGTTTPKQGPSLLANAFPKLFTN